MTFQAPNEITWHRLAEKLEESVPFSEWREAPWLPVVMYQGGLLGRVRAFQLVEEPHAQSIESAIEQWLGGGGLSTLGLPATYLLALRFHVVGFLLRSFEGVLPIPQAEQVQTLYRSFLLDWWRRVGANYAVGFSCAEYDPEGISDAR